MASADAPTSVFVRYRHGNELRVPADLRLQLAILAKDLQETPDHDTVFRRAIADIRDGGGAGIAVASTWAETVREVFTAFEDSLQHGGKEALLELLRMLGRDQAPSDTWDEIRSIILAHIDLLSGWDSARTYRSAFFPGEIQRDADGKYYFIDAGQKVEVIGAKTLEEERFQYIMDDVMRPYGRIGRLLRLVALVDIADQNGRNPQHFSERNVCWLPDGAFLQWRWHVAGVYDYVPAPWRPRSHCSDPAWLGADLVANLPGALRVDMEQRQPPQDVSTQQFQEASEGLPYQYDVAVQTDLFLGEQLDVYFDFGGRKIRWINGTRQTYPIVSIWCSTQDATDERAILKRFLSALVKEAKFGIVEIAGGLGPTRYYPYIRQPRTLGGLILDPRYLLRNDTRYADRKALALALYREAASSKSVYYSFLCYYKIVQLAFNEHGARITSWIESNIDPVLERVDRAWRAEVLAPGETASTHLYQSGRNAVAHVGGSGPTANPDDPDHYRRFYRDAAVVRALAEVVFQQNLL